MDSAKKIKRKPHPKIRANPLSRVTFCWTLPTFIKGLKKDIIEEDLFEPLKDHKSNRLGNQLGKSWKKEQLKSSNPSLWKALGRIYLLEFVGYGFALVVIEFLLRLSQPLALGRLIKYFTPNQTTISKEEAYFCAFAIVASSFLHVFIAHSYMLGIHHLGMKIRIACCSLIYRKSLRLSRAALGETNIGQMINLLSNDVHRFDTAVVNIHNVWLAPLETAVFCYIMYLQVGLTATTGVCLLVLFIPIQMYLGKKCSAYRFNTALKTDERIRLMNEIISGIQVIKMYTWEKPFAKLVAATRSLEMKQIRGSSYVRALIQSFRIFTSRFALFITIMTHILVEDSITAEYVFVVTAFYNILRQAMTVFFPIGITQVAEVIVSVKRIKNFLMYDEIQLHQNDPNCFYKKVNNSFYNDIYKTKEAGITNCIVLKRASATWLPSSLEKHLSCISLSIKQNQLVAIIGPVGCGKTSLLHLILKELPLKYGELQVNGQISYASQDPWLFAGTLQQNILFGQPMDSARYRAVIRACALERDLSLLPRGDKSIVGDRGVNLSGGQKARINLARAVYKKADIYLLDDPLSAVDTHVGKQLFDDCIATFLNNKCVVVVTHQLQYLKNIDQIYLLQNGEIKISGTYQELQKSGVDFTLQLSKASDEDEDKSENTKDKQHTLEFKSSNSSLESTRKQNNSKIRPDVYCSYLKSGGNWFIVIGVFLLFILTQLAASAGDYFIAYWVNSEKAINKDNMTSFAIEQFTSSRNTHIYIYSGIIIITIVLTLVRSYSFFAFCLRASSRLHDKMFTNIVHASMNFFQQNTSGRILNRFSKDIGCIDDVLPSIISDFLQIGLTVAGTIIVVTIVNPWLLIPTAVILIIFSLLRTVYLLTSRNVKRVESTTRSPVFGHISASLQGITTIRAFGAQKILEEEFDNHQDLHSSAFDLFLYCSRAFGFWLDLICVIYIGIVTLSFLVGKTKATGGNVGLAITQALGLTGIFQWGIRQWSELENQMTCVERVVEYTKVEREVERSNSEPVENWPRHGQIIFQSVSLRYSIVEPYILKDVSFIINSREKIGIVGRTGAGKSSLINALFQLEATQGAILVDDLDISKISLNTLRLKISIIPQEPVLFSGPLRKNLDPFDDYTDEELWKALEEVELKNIVNDLPLGLNNKMMEGGSNFSVGQRQLFCLARAILRKNTILVLDEATANVDPQTDALIQNTIRQKFVDCTVLTIAHRLHTVMDSDKVLVMDCGSVIEFDHPHVLLRNEKSMFSGMVQQTGNSMKTHLTEVAEENYKNKQEKRQHETELS